MKLITASVSGFYGFDDHTVVDFVDNRVICVGANGTGKSNILRLVEFFLAHGTGRNVKLHWENGDSVWEPHKQCLASLSFELNPSEQDIFSKWRVVAIVSLLLREPYIKQLVRDMEEQDLMGGHCNFSNVEMHPDEVANEYDMEDCPLFRKLRPYKRSVPRKVELFWELIESTLLELYAKKKPYDHAIYYAHTEARDTSNVVFQQIVCSRKDKAGILKQLEKVYVNHQAKFVFPSVCTLELEVIALRSALLGSEPAVVSSTTSQDFVPSPSEAMITYKGVSLARGLDPLAWERVESHLKYGLTPEETATLNGMGSGLDYGLGMSAGIMESPIPTTAQEPLGPSARHMTFAEILQQNSSTAPPSAKMPTSGTNMPPPELKISPALHHSASGSSLIPRPVPLASCGALSLVNCGFTAAVIAGETPPIISLSDVKAWCSNLLLKTERFMTNRPPGSQMSHVKGMNYLLRRMLLHSVAVLSQDRIQPPTGYYNAVSQENVEAVIAGLIESGNRSDEAAVRKIQEGMKTVIGHELQSHRLFGSSATYVGTHPAVSQDRVLLGMGLKSVGGGYKELLMVLTTIHGTGADTVLLDSPGYSLHPPQQKALALWISKFLYLDIHNGKVSRGNPSAVLVITNSTEFVTEDSLPSLYCFRRVVQSSIVPYLLVGKKPNNSSFSSVAVYEKPFMESKVVRTISESDMADIIYCRGGAYGFNRLADGSGYIHSSHLAPYENGSASTDQHLPLQEMVTRVRSFQSSSSNSLLSSEILKILDPELKRLVFATGVFFFEGQSDYRVIEALKHVASGVTWEIVIMHGAGEIPKVVKIVNMLSIPYGIIVDFDQIVPTVSSVKHTNTITAKLWKSSQIYRFLCDQCAKCKWSGGGGRHAPPTAVDSKSSRKPPSNSYSIEDIYEILTTFKRENADDVELTEKLKVMTGELKQYMHSSHISRVLEVAPACDRFVNVKDRIDNIVDDAGMHMGIKTALVRHALREVGVFTWNADVEGMIFGYGDPVHGQLVIDNMPQSMKDFCMDHEKSLSGIAYDVYMFDRSSASKFVSPALKSRKGKPSEHVNDYDRLLYLIEAAPTGYLLSSTVARAYRKCFGCRLECVVDGLQLTFTALIESLKSNPFVKITTLDRSEFVQALGAKASAKSESRRVKNRHESGDEIIGEDSGFSVLDDDANSDEDSDEAEGNEESSVDGDGGEEDDESNDDYFFRRGRVAASTNTAAKIRVVSRSRSPMPSGSTAGGKNITGRNSKEADAAGGRYGQSHPRDKKSRPTGAPTSSDDTDDVEKVLYKLEWVGVRKDGPIPEHPGHVFRNPQYWIFVGHVLHGGRDRGGMWKQLPWGILKDVILSTKRMKVVDNLAGAFLSTEDIKRHGKQAANSALHVGLQDLLEWMEDMESRSIVASDGGDI